MKKYMKKALAIMISVAGTMLAVYVGAYLLFAKPMYLLMAGFKAGTLTAHFLVVSIIKIFLASTVGGFIWVVCDIIAGKFREYPYD